METINSAAMIPKPPEHVAVITDGEQLTTCAARLATSDWLVVDTEFLRERTYYPELCLVQIASRDEVALIDTLAIKDLSSLHNLLDDTDILKVFHAADQDLEVLNLRLGSVPEPVFDTQIAAALLGIGDQIGYASAVETLTGVQLAKDHTRTDWSRRPLSNDALVYAADDVRYLAVIYPILREQLEQQGRMAWAMADSVALVAKARHPVNTTTAWRRVRGLSRLPAAQQQVIAALAQWRECEAMRANRPRKWILSDDALHALARRQPEDKQQLDAIKSLPPKVARRHGEALLAAIESGQAAPAKALAAQPQPLTAEQKALYKKVRQTLTQCATQSDIPAPALARRKELEQMVQGKRDVPVLQGWRAEVAGTAILDVIEGRADTQH